MVIAYRADLTEFSRPISAFPTRKAKEGYNQLEARAVSVAPGAVVCASQQEARQQAGNRQATVGSHCTRKLVARIAAATCTSATWRDSGMADVVGWVGVRRGAANHAGGVMRSR